MNFTQLMIAFIIAIGVISGLNLFAGDVLTQYNSTVDNSSTGMNNYNTGYVSWVTGISESTKATVQKAPEGILGQIITGVFWAMDSVKNFLGITGALTTTLNDLGGQAQESGIIVIPNFTWSLIAMAIGVAFVGYLLYLLIGRSGDNSGSV
jgi:hypothetical protein